jgi:hypothetical protein
MASAKTMQRFSSPSEQKAEIYRYWQSRPIAERFMAVWDASLTAYALTGITYDPTRRSKATLTRVQRTRS